MLAPTTHSSHARAAITQIPVLPVPDNLVAMQMISGSKTMTIKTTPESSNPDSQPDACNTVPYPKPTLDSSPPKALPQPGMTPSSVTSSACSSESHSSSPMSSALSPGTLSPSTSNSSTSSTNSLTPSETVSNNTTESSVTRQLCPGLLIIYNKRALMKLHGRLQICILNSVSVPIPAKDTKTQRKSHQLISEDN